MRLPHVTPFARHPIYFFTACTARRRPLLAREESFDCLQNIWKKSAELDGWLVGRFVFMPDHLHLFASPSPEAKSRAQWLKSWKSISSRHLVKTLGLDHPVWQADTFDHILRSAESYALKWDYVRANPIRKGLVARTDDWPWQGEIHSLAF
jgi:REP element-mobilizing transposase RayT